MAQFTAIPADVRLSTEMVGTNRADAPAQTPMVSAREFRANLGKVIKEFQIRVARRHFRVRILPAQPRSPVSVGQC